MKLTHANLLTTGNPKTLKGETDGYFTAVLHLAPSTLSGKNVCPFATAACIFGCLNHAGRGGIFKKGEITNAIQLARIARTNWYHDNRADFLLNLERAITLHVKRAKQNGLTPCIRLNGTSDLSIENWGILERFPDVQFYDYTAVPKRTFDFANHKLPENYHLTFSRKETPLNHTAAKLALKRGVSVAVVFDTKRVRRCQVNFGASQ